MQRKPLAITAAALLLAVALPALGYGAEPRIVALQIRVNNLNTQSVDFVPIEERIALEPGQRYRISLVGADRQGDRSGDIGIHARFREASGRGAIDLGNAEGNWVIVEPINRSNGQASIEYVVAGNYNMPAAWRTGRIHFDLVRSNGAGSYSGNYNGSRDGRYNGSRDGRYNGSRDGRYGYNGRTGSDRERLRHAEDVVTVLYRGVLHESPSRTGRDFQAAVDRVNRDGIDGLRDVAGQLAREAQDRGVFNDRRSTEVVAALYRDLLGRECSYEEIYRSDRAVREYADWLRDRDGLVRLVVELVTSDEFRRDQELDQYGLMRSARYRY